MARTGIPCGHSACSHESGNRSEHFVHHSLHFTASVMGNPEYLKAIKDIPQAKDERHIGLHAVNPIHAKPSDPTQEVGA